MPIDKRVERVILDSISKTDYAIHLLDETGEILISKDSQEIGTIDPDFDDAYFVGGVAELENVGKTYFTVDSDNYRPLRLMINDTGKQVVSYGSLLVTLISELLRTAIKSPGREEVFKNILLDRSEPLEVQEAIQSFGIQPDAQYCVVLVQTFEGDVSNIYNLLIELFPRSKGDMVVAINRYVVALVKTLQEESDDMETVIQMVRALDNTIEDEISVTACIGVGGIKVGLANIRDSFEEAQEAVSLGLMQQHKGRVFLFQKLLLERFLQEVPRDVRRHFFDLAYSDALKKIMTDEMLQTITQFFEDNLNLSEAARRLYIHRNTLIYRLEKVQRATGLDLRNFDDAVLLKIVIMMGKSLSANNRLE